MSEKHMTDALPCGAATPWSTWNAGILLAGEVVVTMQPQRTWILVFNVNLTNVGLNDRTVTFEDTAANPLLSHVVPAASYELFVALMPAPVFICDTDIIMRGSADDANLSLSASGVSV